MIRFEALLKVSHGWQLINIGARIGLEISVISGIHFFGKPGADLLSFANLYHCDLLNVSEANSFQWECTFPVRRHCY